MATSACSTGSRWRGGNRCRVASALAATGRLPRMERNVDNGDDGQDAFSGSSGMGLVRGAKVDDQTKPGRVLNGIRILPDDGLAVSFGVSTCHARRTKTPNSACGFMEVCSFGKLNSHCSCNNHLRNSHSAFDLGGLTAVIDQTT